MSDLTIVQLMAAQRNRELRAQPPTAGKCDWVEVPIFCVFVVCLILWLFVASGIVAITNVFRPNHHPE
jgi:hypothetical protein